MIEFSPFIGKTFGSQLVSVWLCVPRQQKQSPWNKALVPRAAWAQLGGTRWSFRSTEFVKDYSLGEITGVNKIKKAGVGSVGYSADDKVSHALTIFAHPSLAFNLVTHFDLSHSLLQDRSRIFPFLPSITTRPILEFLWSHWCSQSVSHFQRWWLFSIETQFS